AQVVRLLPLVPLVASVDPARGSAAGHDGPAGGAALGRAAVGAAAELGHRDGLAGPAEAADQVPVAGGVARVPVGVHRDDVEGPPVDVLPQPGGVADRPAEPAPGTGRRGGQDL